MMNKALLKDLFRYLLRIFLYNNNYNFEYNRYDAKLKIKSLLKEKDAKT